MSLEVPERVCRLDAPGERSSEDVSRDPCERETVTLSIQGVDDLVEAQQITDEWQILTVAHLIRMREGTGHNVAKLANVSHVNATHIRIKRKRPAHGSVCLFLRSLDARKIAVVEWRDDEGMICEPSSRDDCISPGLAGKVGNVELAAADRFYVRQCRPDKVFDTGILGSTD